MNRPGFVGDFISWKDAGTSTRKRYSPVVRNLVVRMVNEHLSEYESPWTVKCSIAGKISCTAEILRKWAGRLETDRGNRTGIELRSRTTQGIPP